MEYSIKVSFRKNISDKEKSDRIKQFQQAFVIATVNFYSNKTEHSESA